MDEQLARSMGGGPADIPGLWWIPGYPELTSGQLRAVASSANALSGNAFARNAFGRQPGCP